MNRYEANLDVDYFAIKYFDKQNQNCQLKSSMI